MSRIGKLPVPIPNGVTVTVDGNTVKVKGPKGELSHRLPGGHHRRAGRTTRSTSQRASDETNHKALHGLTRSLIANMVEGVTKGYQKQLEITGVGYKAEVRPYGLQLALGFSHPIEYKAPAGIKLTAPQPTQIVIDGVGQGDRRTGRGRAARSASARAVQGQGHQVRRRVIRRKAGKAGGK